MARWQIGVVATALCAPVSALASGPLEPRQDDPTYYRDVLPIVYERCAPCHRTGGVAALDLDSYDVASSFASVMADQTQARTMPPFPPDPECAEYREHERRSLSEEQIQTISHWAELGAPEGDVADAPEPPEPPENPLGDPSLVLQNDSGYLFDNQAEDQYMCFRFDPGLAEPRDLVAATIAPDNENIVHHVIVFREPEGADRKPQGLPGFECGGAPEDGEFLFGWAPGTEPFAFPDGYGIPLEEDDALIMQVHYHRYPGAAPTDRSAVELWFADQPVDKKVEVVWTGSFDILVPPGLKQTVEGTCRVPEEFDPVELIAVAPHMHQVGTAFHSYVERADDTDECLVDIPEWDFEWQGGYTFSEPVLLQPGDTVHTSCEYHNTGESTVRWGEGTNDEMCFQFNFVVAQQEIEEFCFDDAGAEDETGGCGCTANAERRSVFAPFMLAFALATLRRRRGHSK